MQELERGLPRSLAAARPEVRAMMEEDVGDGIEHAIGKSAGDGLTELLLEACRLADEEAAASE